MTKQELLNSPDYTYVEINGQEWVKHGNRLHRGNYYHEGDKYIDINSLSGNIKKIR